MIAAIRDLKARGLEVFLYPFVMMDVPVGNGLADPYGRAEQPAYPWRGEVTCYPAVGQAGSGDTTAEAAAQVAAFCGAAGGKPPLAGAGWAPVVHILDLPVIEGADETAWARAAACSRPWRAFSLWSSTDGENGERRTDLTVPARIGELTAALGAGRPGRFDRTGELNCKLYFGGVYSASTLDVLNGANVLAVKSAVGAWEVLQFAEAEEVAPGEWRLTQLLRGQAGTEDAAVAGAAAGAPVVVLDASVVGLGLRRARRGWPSTGRRGAVMRCDRSPTISTRACGR